MIIKPMPQAVINSKFNPTRLKAMLPLIITANIAVLPRVVGK